jgi:hypothetical protein
MLNDPTLLRAIEDLRVRTLNHIPSDFARLVYLSSTRDYNTGLYSHDGLAYKFTRPMAEMALETCHEEIFERISRSCLEELVQELSGYLTATKENPRTVIESWKAFAPYQMLTPRGCTGSAKELFIANVRISLEVLQADPALNAHSDKAASPQQ